MKLSLKELRLLQLLVAELIVPVEHTDLDHNLDDVLDQLLRLGLVPRVHLAEPVEVVQQRRRRAIDEGLGDVFGGHA